MSNKSEQFWQVKTLDEMTPQEWESLCDGCGRCCLTKLEDMDTSEIFYTRVICRYFNLENCRCTVYEQRTHLVPACLKLDPILVTKLSWMPITCAYRRLVEGKGLADWHPLVSGDPKSVHRAGISVKRKVIVETEINPDDLTNYITEWFD
jgi:uncharacterized cysteine cluster protein YcgN (CxxCxxCC family)